MQAEADVNVVAFWQVSVLYICLVKYPSKDS
jgi:hypothetical protein